ATNLTTGNLASFDWKGLHLFDPHDRGYKKDTKPLNQLPVARCVAASSAFPVVFSPVRIDNSDAGGANSFEIPQLFADGGIYENLGIEGFVAFYAGEPWAADHVFAISDGQAVYDPKDSRRFALLPSRASRTIDILMHRMSLWKLVQLQEIIP